MSGVPSDASEIIHGTDLNSSDLFVQNISDRIVLEHVASQFGIGKITNITSPLHHTTTSKKAIVETANGRYFIKEKAAYAADEVSLNLSGEFQIFLSGHLSKCVPKLMRRHNGATYAESGSRRYVAMPEVRGQAFVGRPGQVYSAGCVLAQIHNLSTKFSAENAKLIPPYRTSQDEARTFIAMASDSSDAKGSLDPHREKALDLLGRIAHEYSTDYDRFVPKIVAHGDFAPSNLLFKGDAVAAVLDFDNVAYHARIRDLGEAIISFCGGMNYLGATSNLRAPISTAISLSLVERFLAGYTENIQVSLSHSEKNYLHSEIVFSWVEHMSLGIIRGDFGFRSILEAEAFVENTKSIAAVTQLQ